MVGVPFVGVGQFGGGKVQKCTNLAPNFLYLILICWNLNECFWLESRYLNKLRKLWETDSAWKDEGELNNQRERITVQNHCLIRAKNCGRKLPPKKYKFNKI